MKKILFMGTPDYAKVILNGLIEENTLEVVGVYTQPDKPVGRKKILTPPPVKVLAKAHNIPVFQPYTLKDEKEIECVLDFDVDFIIVAAYGQILPKEIVKNKICINLHASILPKYRGASPIQMALLNGDEQTGVTAMLMDEGLDTGDIIKISKTDIKKDEVAPQLFERLSLMAKDLTLDVVKNFSGYTPKPQDEKNASYCKKITKKDGVVTLENAKDVYNRYRAYYSWPGIFLESGLKLKKIGLNDDSSSNTPGEILDINEEYVTVGCTKGSVNIYTLQAPSKKETTAYSYINGKRLKVGDSLS